MDKERSAASGPDERWWLRPQRKLPRAVLYAGVLGVTVLTQIVAYKLTLASTPNQWTYALPKDRALSFAADPTLPQSQKTLAPVSPHLIDQALAEQGGTPVHTPTPTPSSTKLIPPTPTQSPVEPVAVNMRADPPRVSVGKNLTFTIEVSSTSSVRVRLVSHVPAGTSAQSGCFDAGGAPSQECVWDMSIPAGGSLHKSFVVTISANAPNEIMDSASAFATSNEFESNVVHVKVDRNSSINS